MPSQIDPDIPADDSPARKSEVRGNFAHARRELDHGGFFTATPAGADADPSPYSGAVERSVRDKLGERVSVLDFGVRPNSGQDHSSEITEAIRQLSQVAEIGNRDYALHFPAGEYLISEVDWSGKCALVGEAGKVNATQLRYAGSGGPGTVMIHKNSGSRSTVNQTTIENMRLLGDTPGQPKRVCETAIFLNAADWNFGLRDVFLANFGRYGLYVEANINLHCIGFRAGQIGWYAIYLPYDRWADPFRPITVTNWTFDNAFGNRADFAGPWAEHGFVPPGGAVAGVLDWFGKGFIGTASKHHYVYLGPGRAEQQERPHPGFGVVVDANTGESGPERSTFTLMGVTGYFASAATAGHLVWSERGLVDVIMLGNCGLVRQKGMIGVGNPSRTVGVNDNRAIAMASWVGGRWNALRSGTGGGTGARPVLSADDVGTTYFDTELNKLIVWNGQGWRYVDGSPV